VGLNSLKSLNLTNGYPNNKNKNKKKKNNKVKSKPLELRSRVKRVFVLEDFLASGQSCKVTKKLAI
jgi:adenine/guanine phosphoribosyltransferase-like PRPP-binding protein